MVSQEMVVKYELYFLLSKRLQRTLHVPVESGRGVKCLGFGSKRSKRSKECVMADWSQEPQCLINVRWIPSCCQNVEEQVHHGDTGNLHIEHLPNRHTV